MSTTFLVLSALAPIGAIDVLYYHLYRFRLFERGASTGAEVTHLLRQGAFVAMAALLATGVQSRLADSAILALFAFDLVNSAVDVLLETSSRASLGGLPRGEVFLHFLGTFGMGLAAASYLYERSALPLASAPLWQAAPLVAGGATLFLVELVLFLRARRRVRMPLTDLAAISR